MKMKHHRIFSAFLLLLLLFSCSAENTAQEAKIEQESTSNVATSPSENRASSDATAIKEVPASLGTEDAKEVTHEEEIALINSEIMRINGNLASYTKKESKANWETLACKLTQYINENGAIVKVESVCGKHDWTMYFFELSKRETKLLYGKHLEKVPDAARPVVREFYSIGTMMPSENAYRLILDESGNELDPDGYRKYSLLYEAAFDAFGYE